MNPLKSRKVAVAVTAVAVVTSAVLGCRRSLNQVRSAALAVFEQGAYGDGIGVRSDLIHRREVCANLCTVAARYLPKDNQALRDLRADLADLKEDDFSDPACEADLAPAAKAVLMELAKCDLTEQDARYASNFGVELDSVAATIAHDPYTQLAQQFNSETLAAFPANVLGRLAGVKRLPTYQ